MMSVVRPRETLVTERWISCSVSVSMEAVASSSTNTAGSCAMARAKDSSWRCPAEKVEPRSVTGVSMPCGSLSMKSRAHASRSARSTCSSVISRLPSRTFSEMLPENRNTS